ncbi:MAG: hypothetical protein WC707_07010 [Candidatus Babeliaceae bacterium]|jgi:hypothetical protein
MSTLKTVGAVAVTGLVLYGGYKLYTLSSFSDKVTDRLSNPRIHKADASGLYFRTEVEVTNPTKTSVTITKPIVYLTTDGAMLTNSNASPKTFTIEKLSNTTIETIEIKLAWIQLLPFAGGILSHLSDIYAAIKNMDISSVQKIIGVPLEMYYTLYANGISYTSKPSKIL